MSYLLVFDLDGKRNLEINYVGNEILRVQDKYFKILKDDEINFDEVIGNIVLSNYYNKQADKPLFGKVRDIFLKDDGKSQKKVCVLDTNNYEIDISYSYIYDTRTNEGWYNLQKGDYVEIYLENNTEKADAIFVKKEENLTQR